MQELLIWPRHAVAIRAPNVFFVRPPESTANDVEDHIDKLHKSVKDLALKAALERPGWLFMLAKPGAEYSTCLYVFSGDESIGRVELESAYTQKRGWDYRLALTSRVIRSETIRKSNIGTDSDKRALKIILDKFVPTPLDQRLYAKASQAAAVGKQKVYNALHYSSDEALSPERVHGFLTSKGLWEEFAAYAAAGGAVADYIPERIAAMQVSQRLEGEVNAGRGRAVVMHDGVYYSYYLSRRWGTDPAAEMHKYSAADLPDSLRGSIGMLKVAEENKVVPGIGIRTETGFVLIGGVDG